MILENEKLLRLFASVFISLMFRRFELVTRGFQLVLLNFQLMLLSFQLLTRNSQLVTRNLCFTISRKINIQQALFSFLKNTKPERQKKPLTLII